MKRRLTNADGAHLMGELHRHWAARVQRLPRDMRWSCPTSPVLLGCRVTQTNDK